MALLPDVLRAAGAPGAADVLRSDPVLNHNFLVSLVDTTSGLDAALSIGMSAIFDIALGGFSECSGLEMTMKTEDIKEGGDNGGMRRFASRVEWSPITLKRGLATNTALWDWHYGFVTGRGHRRDGLIVLLDSRHLPAAAWMFTRALPVKYTAPALNATQNQVAIEAIEIAHEGVFQIPFTGAISGIGGLAKGQAGALIGAAGGAVSGAFNA
jgi:phage tail-like protein